MSTALIAGASGLVGSHILATLLYEKIYDHIIVLSRRELDLAHNPALNLEIIDFDDLNISLKNIQADHVYLSLGTTQKKAGSKEAFHLVDYRYQVEILRIMQQQGASRFAVVSSVGADPKSLSYYLKTKGEMEASMLKVNPSLLHIVRPSLLLGDRQEFRLTEELSKKISRFIAPLLMGSLQKYRPVHARDVGRFLVEKMQQEQKGIFIWESHEIVPFA